MVATLLPLVSRMRRRLGGTLAAHAVEQVELAPAATIDDPPAIALPNEWARVRGFSPGTDATAHRAQIEGGPARQPATTAYRVRDAFFSGTEVYAGGDGDMLVPGGPRILWRGRAERVPAAQLAASHTICRYFAHWLFDGLPAELLAERRGLPPLTVARPGWGHVAGYRAAAGLPGWTPAAARIDDLWIIDDRHLNQDRRARHRELRRRLRRPGAEGPRRLFLDRGDTGARRALANGDAVLAVLAAHGFTTLYPERETPARIAEALSTAELCVGVEGSQLAHAVTLLPPEAALLVLMPPRRFTALMKGYADMAGMRFAYLVGEEVAGSEDFTVDPERLAATLALLA